MSKYILKVYYGLDHDHIGYVEMSSGYPLRVLLTEYPSKATYRSLRDARNWAKDILNNGKGTGTWKIEVMPIEEIQGSTTTPQPNKVLSDDELREAIDHFHKMCLGNLVVRNDGGQTQEKYEAAIRGLTGDLMNIFTQQRQAYADAKGEIVVAGKCIKFSHTAVNLDMHMFIDGYHNPTVCPECIVPGTLVATLTPTKETEK